MEAHTAQRMTKMPSKSGGGGTSDKRACGSHLFLLNEGWSGPLLR